ncbi:HBR395Cp [Eremothecium sinecaudum]|uniref:HBR395Cp n=1 Tax=Eremothecium sinecaudum TaxID=45286 RepID=A0A109UVH3_9SACH|nr:HBR395Cp [Eremothecium sinecaudum]AMD19296.1 HBR395Cp [Eremothecium sinecaudum]
MSSDRNQAKRQDIGEKLSFGEDRPQEDLGRHEFTPISAEETFKLFNLQRQVALPDADVMFPWLHGLAKCRSPPKTDKFQLSIISSQTLQAGMIENSGILKSSIDLNELLLNLKDPTQDLRSIVATEIKEYGVLTGVNTFESEVNEVIEACKTYQLLPFLLTDNLKQFRYGKKNKLGEDCGMHDMAWKQPVLFRRFDLQPAKHLEMSKIAVIYCLSPQHPNECLCHYAGIMVRWASRFVLLNYVDYPENELDIRVLDPNDSIPRELIGTIPMSNKAVEKSHQTRLASKFDLASFNNWERDLLYKERLEISKMSSVKKIAPSLCCGNSTDYEILYLGLTDNCTSNSRSYYSYDNTVVTLHDLDCESSDNPDFDSKLFNLIPKDCVNCGLFIHCAEAVGIPDRKQIENHLSDIDKSPIHLKFPSSGSIGLGSLTLESIKSLVNLCHYIHQFHLKTNMFTLIYCSDGYTESSFLLVAYLIFIWDLSLDEVLLRLTDNPGRPFFLFPIDMQILGHLQLLLQDKSPLRHPERTSEPITVEPELFSKMFFSKPCQDEKILHMKGPLPSRILPHLYLGSSEHAHHPKLLQDLQIRNIVSVGVDVSWLQLDSASTTGTNSHESRSSSAESKLDGGLYSSAVKNSNLETLKSAAHKNIFSRNRRKVQELPNAGEQSCTKTTLTTKDGFNVYHISELGDNGADSMLSQLDQILSFIDECHKRNEKVLVHCMVGVSRSATVCIAECMKELNCGVVQAYLFVRVRRLNIIIQPNLMFIYELLKWQELNHPDAMKIDWHILCRAIAELNSNYIQDLF